jgi:hypothetical protein
MQSLLRMSKTVLIHLPALLLCVGLAKSVHAQSDPAQSPLGGPWTTGAPQQFMLLAQATPPATSSAASAARKGRLEAGAETVDAPWYGQNKVHKYLGLASLGAAAITMLSPKKEGGPHEFFANASAALGGAAVATGAYAHWSDLDFTWKDPDSKHALFGVLGTLGFVLAVAQGGEGGHAGAGALGAISMITAIKYTW